MLIVTALYIVLVWLVFSRLKILPFNWPWRIAVVLAGIAIGAVFLGLINTLVPQGRLAVYGKVAEITPNVAGTVISVPVGANTKMKAGSVLFQLDPTPFQTKVRQLEAALADAEQRATRLKVDLQAAGADVDWLTSQLAYNATRCDDLEKLARSNSSSEFLLRDATAQVDSLATQLEAAKAKQTSLRLAAEAEIGGENTIVAQTHAQLDQAKWELNQTTIRAPADGYATNIGLTAGTRATPFRAAMSFVNAEEVTLVAVFPQNGLGAIKPGALVKFVLNNAPGAVYETTVDNLLSATGEGQAGASGMLTRVSSAAFAGSYPVRLNTPESVDKQLLLPGVSGVATAYHAKAGPIGTIGTVLTYIAAWLAYL
jgi:multidrug resistance efflux pump